MAAMNSCTVYDPRPTDSRKSTWEVRKAKAALQCKLIIYIISQPYHINKQANKQKVLILKQRFNTSGRYQGRYRLLGIFIQKNCLPDVRFCCAAMIL